MPRTGRRPTPMHVRFWQKVEVRGPVECWRWRGALAGGYGQIGAGGTHGLVMLAHRYAYEQAHGAIPEGLSLDHVCRNTWCVNPAHLEAVTHRENVLRGIGPTAANARKTHCRRGHPFTPENTRISVSGSRICRACDELRLASRPKASHCKRGHPYNDEHSYIVNGRPRCRTCQREMRLTYHRHRKAGAA